MGKLYLLAAVLGLVLSYAYFIPFVVENGLDISLLFSQLSVNRISTFFGMDVIVSTLALWIFVFSEGRRLGMKNLWFCILCNLTVGVSLALPLFLYFRESKVAGRQ